MPKRKSDQVVSDSSIELKTLALRDDHLVHQYRDLHYQLVLDQLQAMGQGIASGETVTPLSDTARKRHMKRHEDLSQRICRKYKLNGFHGGDPYIVKKDGWLATIQVSLNERLRIETNWRTSFFSPRVQLLVIPKGATVYASAREPIYKLPNLPKRPQTSPCMTIHLDLSQVKPNALGDLAREFKQAVEQCLAELPQRHRKPSSSWLQNVERDYRRFQHHFYQGVPYRWIAIYELSGKMPKRRVTGPVPTESSVRDSVERVHHIVFGKKLRASRRPNNPRADALLNTTIKRFDCPEHGRDCSTLCQYAREFIKNLEQIR